LGYSGGVTFLAVLDSNFRIASVAALRSSYSLSPSWVIAGPSSLYLGVSFEDPSSPKGALVVASIGYDLKLQWAKRIETETFWTEAVLSRDKLYIVGSPLVGPKYVYEGRMWVLDLVGGTPAGHLRFYGNDSITFEKPVALPDGTVAIAGGYTDEAPAAVVTRGRLWLVVRGLDYGLYFGYVDLATGSFSGWQCILGGTPYRLALATVGSRLWLVVTGFDGRVWVNWYNLATGQWSTWQPVPDKLIDSAPAAYYAGKFYIFVRGLKGLIYYVVTSDDVSFSPWYTVGGSTPSAPYSTSDGTRLYLVVHGDDNRIWVSQ